MDLVNRLKDFGKQPLTVNTALLLGLGTYLLSFLLPPPTKKIMSTPLAPSAIGPYSQATLSPSGRTLYVSGCIGLLPSGGFAGTTITEQTRQALLNLQAIIESSGFTLSQAQKTSVLLTDMSDYKTVNEVYVEFFNESKPARAAYAVKELPAKAMIEIDCVCCR
ncbi:hypothetical protein TrST_g33 [Triparma strigata]|uniref:Uncharacterized protein n=1 Tax=Triparma strigata TaxID=1606541 RepID=A0A9W7AVM1_9STRA|nr:hypothetical protein TrST_g33 [Triparma strigata]